MGGGGSKERRRRRLGPIFGGESLFSVVLYSDVLSASRV